MAKSTAVTKVEENHVTELMADGPIAGVGLANPSRRAAAIREGKMSRRIVTLTEGMALDGLRLLGEGPPVECRSPDGDTSLVKTWNFEVDSDVTIGILGSHQLDSELPAYVGKSLYIEKGPMKRANGRQIAQWIIVDLDGKA